MEFFHSYFSLDVTWRDRKVPPTSTATPSITSPSTAPQISHAATCVLVEITLRQGDAAATHATVLVSAKDAPASTATFNPNVGGDDSSSSEFIAVLDHLIGGIRIDATAGSDPAALWSDAGLTTLYEASIERPDSLAVGGKTAMR